MVARRGAGKNKTIPKVRFSVGLPADHRKDFEDFLKKSFRFVKTHEKEINNPTSTRHIPGVGLAWPRRY